MAEEGRDKSFGIEILEIFDSFPNTDQANRNVELFGNRDDNASARRAIKLRQDYARDPHGFVELAGLNQRVLPNRRIQNQQHFVGRAR